MPFQLIFGASPTTPLRAYHLVEDILLTDRACPRLARVDDSIVPPDCAPLRGLEPSADSPMQHLPNVWLGGDYRTLTYRVVGDRLRLAIDEAGDWSLELETGRSRYLGGGTCSEPQLMEIGFGPGLIPPLAWHGVFCLHASSVRGPAGVHVFLGDSGAGKSTLACAAAEHRVTDDITPIVMDETGVWVLPRFPQLKLAPADQYPARAATRLPVQGFYRLMPQPAASGPTTLAGPITGVDALRALTYATVASRLFPPTLLQRHLQIMGRMARSIPVWQLLYPWGLEHLATTLRRLGIPEG